MVPTLKFSVTTSARRTSSLKSSTPRARLQLEGDGQLVPLPVLRGGHPLLDAIAPALDAERHALAAALARLDLDDPGAQVGEQHGAERHGDDLTEIQHGDVTQRLVHSPLEGAGPAHRSR